jgi:hypothetical protein
MALVGGRVPGGRRRGEQPDECRTDPDSDCEHNDGLDKESRCPGRDIPHRADLRCSGRERNGSRSEPRRRNATIALAEQSARRTLGESNVARIRANRSLRESACWPLLVEVEQDEKAGNNTDIHH